ncbi:uncharacterized protein V6R79_013449 [Siganus canaliculatus]
MDTRNRDFGTLVRTFSKYIKADYHLHRVSNPTPNRMPQFFKTYQRDLIAAVRPIQPTPATALLAKHNSINWTHTSLQIMQEHYQKSKEVRGIREEEVKRGERELSGLVRGLRGKVEDTDVDVVAGSSRGSSLLIDDGDSANVASEAGSTKRKAPVTLMTLQ